MIIYRDQKTRITSAEFADRIAVSLRELEWSGYADHRYTVDLLIDWGEFETAVADTLFPHEDGITPVTAILRRLSLLAGRIFYRSWAGKPDGIAPLAREMEREIGILSQASLPSELQIGVSEGYAYYGLYPETFLEAAKRFQRDVAPERVVSIGLRSIGTSLSASVGAALQELGCRVESYTVRPRGHPFDRHLSLTPELSRMLASQTGAYFLIADEGPGLSGSSLGCAAHALSELGHDDAHIIYFPSWKPDRMGFASESTRDHWQRHRKYSADFETVLFGSGRLFPKMEIDGLLDISAGKWREFFYTDPADYPAVFPQHERRKYLSIPESASGIHAVTGPGRGDGEILYKFAGLGHYGRKAGKLAELLAESGFSPPAVGLENGFLVTEFIPGRPLTILDTDTNLLDTIARYLSFLKKSLPEDRGTPFEKIYEMVHENVLESLGEYWADMVKGLEEVYKSGHPGVPIALDGRMLPHEWIVTDRGLLKADGANHFDDHFFPGIQDIAWDVAAVCVEFDLDRAGRDYLLERYITLTGDRALSSRLPYHTIIYLSSRLGYAFEAAEALNSTPDGERFRILSRWYSALLQRELAAQFCGIFSAAPIIHPYRTVRVGVPG